MEETIFMQLKYLLIHSKQKPLLGHQSKSELQICPAFDLEIFELSALWKDPTCAFPIEKYEQCKFKVSHIPLNLMQYLQECVGCLKTMPTK